MNTEDVVRPGYYTRELTKDIWPDFERLFSGGNGWDFCWCVGAYERARTTGRGFGAPASKLRTRAERAVRNHQEKKQSVEQGLASGILVYAKDDPIGWCRYSPVDPVVAGQSRKTAELTNAQDTRGSWSVNCFVVDKRHRRKGVASLALRAALESIRNRGGGLVEAYPIARWTHGPDGTQDPAYVHGVGPVAPAHGSFGIAAWVGTVSMFEKEGFAAVAVFGARSAHAPRIRRLGARGYQVLMRKTV